MIMNYLPNIAKGTTDSRVSSAYQSHLFKSYHKFKILIKPCAQYLKKKNLLYDQTSAPKSARFEEEQETKAAVEAPTAADAEVKTGIAAEAVHCDNTLSSADALTEVGARVHPNSVMILLFVAL